MNRQEIIEKLKEIAELTVQDPAILANMNEDSDLNTDLGLSSVGILYIAIAIEEMFNIRMDDVRKTMTSASAISRPFATLRITSKRSLKHELEAHESPLRRHGARRSGAVLSLRDLCG